MGALDRSELFGLLDSLLWMGSVGYVGFGIIDFGKCLYFGGGQYRSTFYSGMFSFLVLLFCDAQPNSLLGWPFLTMMEACHAVAAKETAELEIKYNYINYPDEVSPNF
jgi:hypothetical protein